MKIVFFFILSSFLYKASIASEKLKIVTLAPNLTEIVYELGLGSFLVGNTTWCDYPEEAKYVNKVADYKNIDLVPSSEEQPLMKNELKNFLKNQLNANSSGTDIKALDKLSLLNSYSEIMPLK